ncbi:putative peptidoglycan muropeptide transporter SLC46 [Brevipalpus obovatus]|uniref:putative peptidoglycan muropeptide transporter SLC46 n=1 Tax=Brevipalpus obovatus TaxID=246614 RepID=UPI003D9F4838
MVAQGAKQPGWWSKLSRGKILDTIKVFRIDLYVLMFAFTMGITHVPSNQLVQDKICLNDFLLSPEICRNIQERPEYTKEAIAIYRKTTLFSTYASLVIFVPSILVTLFLGRWLDRYPQNLKFVLAAPLLGFILYCLGCIYQCIHFEIDYMSLLWVKIPFGLFGGIGLFFSCTFTHVTRETSLKNRPIRYGMIDFCFRIGFGLSMSAGGAILASRPWFADQNRNYVAVYSFAALISFLTSIWALVAIKGSARTCESDVLSDQNDVKTNLRPKQSEPDGTEKVHNNFKQKRQNDKKTAIAHLFDFSNITQMIRTLLKKRPERRHIKLWNLMASMTLALICSLGEMTVSFQFVQAVYKWDARYYSNVKTLTALMPAFGGVILPIILVQKFHVRDTTMGIIGSSSIILAATLKGGIMEPFAFFLGEAVSMCTQLLSISFRSIMSKIISFEEIGQVFTVFSCIQSTTPIISAAFYSAIFNGTVEFYPGFVYHVVAMVIFYPLMVAIWVDFTDKPPKSTPVGNQNTGAHQGEAEKFLPADDKSTELTKIKSISKDSSDEQNGIGKSSDHEKSDNIETNEADDMIDSVMDSNL